MVLQRVFKGYPRRWINNHLRQQLIGLGASSSNGSSSCQNEPFSFTLLTYNILAQSLFNRHEGFSYCSKESARWSVRRENLYSELKEYNADIVCLQECDKYDDFWKEHLEGMGYATFYNPQYNPTKGFKPMPYGLLFAVKSDKFQVLESEVVLMEQELLSDASISDMSELEREEIKHSGNIAQIFVLKSTEFAEEGLILTNSHLFWRPECNYVRLRQLMLMIARTLEVYKKYPDYAILSCGDFNTTPASFPYKLLTLPGRVLTEDFSTNIRGDLVHHNMDFGNMSRENVDRYFRNVNFCEQRIIEEFKSTCGNMELKVDDYLEMEKDKRAKSITALVSFFVKNYPSFISMYSFFGNLNPEDHSTMKIHDKWEHGEVYYTMYTPEFKSTLDYIFMWHLDESKLELSKLLSIPLPEELNEQEALPNDRHSSDHISLMVELVSTRKLDNKNTKPSNC